LVIILNVHTSIVTLYNIYQHSLQRITKYIKGLQIHYLLKYV